MNPIAIFVLIAAFSLVTVAQASAKNVTAPQSDSERITNTVAGPPPAGTKSKPADTAQPTKATLKKSKVKPKPPLTDPN